MQLIKDVLSSVIAACQTPEAQRRSLLRDRWPSIAGPKIAPHTQPSLTRDGRLYVWVDQSALAYELSQKHRQSLLKRIQALVGEDAVKGIFFRVGQLR